ncbi:MAG: hypothetical protein RL339_1856 [Pseudomonadota bacterium]
MKKAEAENAIRHLATKWHSSVGRPALPSFFEFRGWVESEGFGYCFDFRSTMGPLETAEHWFDSELNQS